jgi:hypothetical protein
MRGHHLNKLVAIDDGIVTKVGLVWPKLEKIVQSLRSDRQCFFLGL